MPTHLYHTMNRWMGANPNDPWSPQCRHWLILELLCQLKASKDLASKAVTHFSLFTWTSTFSFISIFKGNSNATNKQTKTFKYELEITFHCVLFFAGNGITSSTNTGWINSSIDSFQHINLLSMNWFKQKTKKEKKKPPSTLAAFSTAIKTTLKPLWKHPLGQ